MLNALRFRFLTALLALPLAGCESFGHGAFVRDSGAVPASIAKADDNAEPARSLSRARSLLDAGNFGLAADVYRKTVEASPGNAQAWLGLAAAYDELRRFDLADRAYQQALQLGGPTVQLLNNRGYSRLLRGDYAAARRDLTAARAKDSSNPQVGRNLTLVK